MILRREVLASPDRQIALRFERTVYEFDEMIGLGLQKWLTAQAKYSGVDLLLRCLRSEEGLRKVEQNCSHRAQLSLSGGVG